MIAWLKNIFRQFAPPPAVYPDREVAFPSAQGCRNTAEAFKNLGNEHFANGELELAATYYQQAIEADPSYADACNNLGVIRQRQNRFDEALACYRKAADLNPELVHAHTNLEALLTERESSVAMFHNSAKKDIPSPDELNQLVTQFNAGRNLEVESRARLLIERHPNYGFAWKMLGVSLLVQGKDALPALRKATELLPDDAEAHNNLGNALKDLGQLDEAVTSCRRALEINPDFAGAYYNLGNALKDLGQFNNAVASYAQALAIKTDHAETHINLGVALQALGQLDEAIASYAQALEMKPNCAEAHSNLGVALQATGRLDDAVASYHRALEIKPDYAEAHNNLGSALEDIGQLDNAVASFRRAIEIKPDYDEAHSNLGNAMKDLGQLDDAEASHLRALKINPGLLKYAIHAHLLLPVIPKDINAVVAWRKHYQAGVAALTDAAGTLEEPGNNVNTSSFYLAYHNYNNRTLMEALCRFFRGKSPVLTATSPHTSNWCQPSARGGRIRVGFLSEYLVAHTIGKLYQGYIHHLDRSRFEVVVIHTPKAKRDSFSRQLDSFADKVLTLPTRLEGQQRAVMAEKLDVLFYPDIGMAQSTYFLAYARLAPVQVVAWGHPDTTGLDTMDYFVSAASIEPEDAEEHYTERLIRLNRIPCFYQSLMVPTQIPNRVTLGLPETGTLYGCPQSLFKFHPDFDEVLAAIAEGDPAGHIVLLEGKHSAWAAQLKARWAKTVPILLDRVLFLPRMRMERFMALMARMDMLLDPIHFGSGNTLYEAMVYGIPVVTWPGQFMRGRIVAAAYRQMGVVDAPIALRLEDYAPLALALGRDPERRRALRSASLEAAERELFADMRVVREFETFLEAAVAAAGRGEKLPVGWKPGNQSALLGCNKR